MTHRELIEQFGIKNIAYSDLLNTSEWIETRKRIIERDDKHCTKCGLSEAYFFGGRFIATKRKVNNENNGTSSISKTAVFLEKRIKLHVHHQFYILDKLPWEYTDESLTTLCNVCHSELHSTQKVRIYSAEPTGLKELNYSVCDKCKGAGVFPEYSHIENGICFQCYGAKYNELIGKPVVIGYI